MGAVDKMKGFNVALGKSGLVGQVTVLCIGVAGYMISIQVSLPSFFFFSASTNPHKCFDNS